MNCTREHRVEVADSAAERVAALEDSRAVGRDGDQLGRTGRHLHPALESDLAQRRNHGPGAVAVHPGGSVEHGDRCEGGQRTAALATYGLGRDVHRRRRGARHREQRDAQPRRTCGHPARERRPHRHRAEAAEHEGDEALAEEISQLLYWTQVLMLSRGLSLDDVYRRL